MNKNEKTKIINKTENKINKLRKTRIWPSVMFLIFSIFVAGGGFLGFMLTMLLSQVNGRLNYIFANAVSVLSSFETVDGNEELFIDNLRMHSVFSDALFVLDENQNLIAGYGKASYIDHGWNFLPQDFLEELFVNVNIDDRYSFCYDNSPELNLLDTAGNLRLDYILRPEHFAVFQDQEKYRSNAKLFEARFWIRYALSDGRTAITKCSIPLYFQDFWRSVLVGLSVLGLMLIPTIFFFCNVITRISDQRRMTKIFYTDTVTAGNNYIFFEHYTEKLLNTRKNAKKSFLIADLSMMKYRNYCNFHGVHAGETLLESVYQEIDASLEKGEICAHSGKASFALLLDCPDREQGENRIRSLTTKLSEEHAKCGIVFHSGIYFTEPQDTPAKRTLDPSDCFNCASAARISLTDDNSPATAVYNEKLLENQLWEHKVEEKMQAALDKEEFKVYLQPKYNPVTEKLSGAEALIRWINEEDGFISPGRFIPIFEANGFITKIDDYMISHVARLQAEWLAEGKSVVPVSVNVSRAHFANPNLAQHICSLVDEYKLPHSLIEIELTESAFFDDKEALLKIVHQLQDMDFEISMDDFGAGYSSLNSLKELPLDVLKLDAEFFRGEDPENRREIVVSQAIQLAKSLNMRIVAEGIEEKEQVDFLAKQGCDMIQGFYFAKPMPAEEYSQRLSCETDS